MNMDMPDDTLLLCGGEYTWPFNYLEGVAKINMPRAKAACEELSARFPGCPAKKEIVE